MITYDAVVIGGGHNGLVAAALLARADQYVLLLERRPRLGGGMVTEEPFPGFKFDTGGADIGWLDPRLLGELQLSRYGLSILPGDSIHFAPLPGGGHLLLQADKQKTTASIGRFSPTDAGRWGAFNDHVARLTGFLQALYGITPPDLFSSGLQDVPGLFSLGQRARQLGSQDTVELLRTLPMSVAEFLEEWFEADVLMGTLGAVGIKGVFQGPYAAGTAYGMLHHLLGSKVGGLRPVNIVRGGVSNLVQALTDVAKRHGVEIKAQSEVKQIRVKEGRAVGVVLQGGEEIAARCVVSNADPKRTFLELVDPLYLDPGFLRQVRNIKSRGAWAQVNLALDKAPDFGALPSDGPHLRGVISISPSLEYLERAFDDAKYGRVSGRPYLEAVLPSLTDPTLAPPGKHGMSILVRYAPYHLRSAEWDEAQREALGDRVVETLRPFAPDLPDTILGRQVLSPLDLEQIYGLTEGDIYHGELTLDQILFMRPVPGWGRYRAPIQNLYLCGAGTHPGGGLVGAPGYNAAQEILNEIR